MLYACRGADIPSGVTLSQAPAFDSIQPDATASGTAASSPGAASNSGDFDHVPKKNQSEPFAERAFIFDPNQAGGLKKGVVYSPLPQGSVLKLWLRYIDENGTPRGEVQYAAVKDGCVGYAFDQYAGLEAELPPQFVIFEMSMWMTDPENAQKEELSALFGENGEHFAGQNSVWMIDGQRVLMGVYTLPLPDFETAFAAELEKWRKEYPELVLDVELDAERGMVVRCNAQAAASQSELDACASRVHALLQRADRSSDLKNPLVVLIDESGNELARYGTDLIQTELGAPMREVYLTDSGAKYHEKGCRYARETSKIIPIDIAVVQGYEPCSLCIRMC